MRTVPATLCLALALGAPNGTTVAAQTAPRPNVVLIVSDDTSIEDYKLLLARGMLPAMKSLVDSGYDFTRAFESGSVGSTSRVSILTGQYAQNHREFGADLFFGGPVRHNESTLLPNWLRSAGYITAMVGRTIPGYGAGDLTDGELQQIAMPIGGIQNLPVDYSAFPPCAHVPPGWDLWVAFCEPYTWSVTSYKASVNGIKVDFTPYNRPVETVHQTDFIAFASDWVIRNVAASGRPWFLAVAPPMFNRELWPGPDVYNVCPDATLPLSWWLGGPYIGLSQRPPLRHLNTIWNAEDPRGAETAASTFPFPVPPSFNEADVSDKPIWVQRNPPLTDSDIDCLAKRWWRRLEGIKSIDDMIGRILAALSETGQLANTYFILTADNGMGDGQHRYFEKLSAYEENIRVPLIIRPPGGAAPQQIDKLVLGIDIAPTIAAVAGAVPTVTVDGRSLLPLMADPGIPWRRMGLLQHTLGAWDAGDTGTAPRDYRALRISSGTERLIVQYPTAAVGVRGEYYDMSADPYQLNNLFADSARQAEIANILPWLNAMKNCSGALCRWLEDNFSR